MSAEKLLANVPVSLLRRLRDDLWLDAHSGTTPPDLARRLSRYATTLGRALDESEAGFTCEGCGAKHCDRYHETTDGVALCAACYREVPA